MRYGDSEWWQNYYQTVGIEVPQAAQAASALAVCREAAEVVSGNGRTVPRDPMRCHARIAALWSAFLGVTISPTDAALMMVLLKAARAITGDFNRDDYIDMTGYAAIAGELADREHDANSKY